MITRVFGFPRHIGPCLVEAFEHREGVEEERFCFRGEGMLGFVGVLDMWYISRVDYNQMVEDAP